MKLNQNSQRVNERFRRQGECAEPLDEVFEPVSGYTRADVLATIFLICLLFGVAATLLADSRGRSQKVVCMDNLRQIGRGFDSWRLEHNDFLPWHTFPTDGGSRGISVGVPWIEFTFLSNSIPSPRTLVCPSDTRRLSKMTEKWGAEAGGFQNSGYRNNSVSYTVGLDNFFSLPTAFLGSDRNLNVDQKNGTCAFAEIMGAAASIRLAPFGNASWTNELHGSSGNILFNDGSVAESTTLELRNVLSRDKVDDNGLIHLLIP